ncbi:serine/threonine-protein kinase tnni3k-related [Anaeramoeba ignava]|uniref:Serine/threonine-protein kinase tnni3k-related n=1 Tax=Anaeramoeba ignava TaxID=1746090 RepID=A0A9Q0R943_ANAIG|nr:serine/threonine-protein kinase tnni3k-related [Anaeramoeba ignava]
MIIFNLIKTKNNSELKKRIKNTNLNELRDEDGNYAIHLGVGTQDAEILHTILNEKIDTNKRNLGGYTGLHIAISLVNKQMAQMLLKRGADPNLADSTKLNTPLHFAVSSGNYSLIKLILSFGPNPFVKNKNQKLPIQMTGSVPIKKFLVRYSQHFADYSPSLFFLFAEDLPSNLYQFQLILSKLNILGIITKSKHSVVYKASYNDFVVALKQIKLKSLKLFQREIGILGICDHPNIVKMIGYDFHQNYPFPIIALEYLQRGNLRSRLQKLKQKKLVLKPKTIIQYAKDIATAMKYLHSKNILHRDLKSSNILVTNDNRLKIADFGLARYGPDDSKLEKEMTTNVGTYLWMAPEILRGDTNYSSKIDVYSYGILLWEIIARDLPFREELTTIPGFDLKHQILSKNSKPKRISENIAPQEILQIMYQCWSYDPKQRPTFDEICKKLDELEQ